MDKSKPFGSMAQPCLALAAHQTILTQRGREVRPTVPANKDMIWHDFSFKQALERWRQLLRAWKTVSHRLMTAPAIRLCGRSPHGVIPSNQYD